MSQSNNNNSNSNIYDSPSPTIKKEFNFSDRSGNEETLDETNKTLFMELQNS